MERLVTSGALRYPAFRLVKEGARFAVSDYASDIPWRPDPFTATIDVARVLEEWETGATIVLQGLHHTWPRVAEFCRELEAELEHGVQTNAYYTPRGSQGLAVHHDTHDVFVLQAAGEKRWLVYDPVWELPLRDQRYRSEMGEPGDPVLDVTLRPGDTLYLPRGWMHEALTSATDSLHLTVGVNVHSWIEALRAALDDCAEDVEFRRAAVAGDADELLARLRARLDGDSVRRRKLARLSRNRRPLLDGQLSQLRAADTLVADTLVERRSGVPLQLDGSAVVGAARRVRFPERVRAQLEFVAAAREPFAARDLPGPLDEAGRIVLVRRLVREGVLRVCDA